MNCAKHTDVAATAYCRTCGRALCANCTRDVQGTIYCEDCLAARINNPGYASTGSTTGAAAPGMGPAPTAGPAPAPAAVVGEGSPGLAAVLGFIPGVGAMYNGQFVKGFIHVIVFASLVWLGNNASEVFGIFVAAWIFYMVFDAYVTAKARRYGQPLPDPLGLNKMFGVNEGPVAQRVVSTGEAIGEGFQTTVNNVRQNWQQPPAGAYQQNPYQQPAGAYQQPVYVAPAEPPATGAMPTGAVILIGLGLLFLLGNLGILGFHWIGRLWPLILIGIGVWLFIRRRTGTVE